MIKIGSKNSLYPHRHFTEHLVEKLPRENNLNHEPSSLLDRRLKNYTENHLQAFSLDRNRRTSRKYGPWGELPAAAQKNLCSKQQGAEENQLWNRELARSRPKPGLDTRTSSTGKSGRESGTQTRGHRSKSDAQTNLRERMKNVQRTAEHTKQIGDCVSAQAGPRETNQHGAKDKGIDLGRSRAPRPRLKNMFLTYFYSKNVK
jgi:hypothetical protein